MSQEKVTIDRAARPTREKQARRKPWARPSRLDAPPAPEGFQHRWIRAEINGHEDKQHVFGRLREGYELVRAEELPEEYIEEGIICIKCDVRQPLYNFQSPRPTMGNSTGEIN